MAECVDDETIAALAEGSLDAAARDVAMAHIAGCARCRGAVSSIARALMDPAVSREVRATARPRLRLVTIASGLAAAAIVALIALPWRSADEAPTHRAPTITAAPNPVLIGPVGIVASAPALRWTGVGGADRYRVTLFDATGGVVYETETTDTTAALPGSVSLERGDSYFWKVEARTGFNRWSSSDLVEFSVQ
jgi:anti-sigma factor ChrR (cupin superfamily)